MNCVQFSKQEYGLALPFSGVTPSLSFFLQCSATQHQRGRFLTWNLLIKTLLHSLKQSPTKPYLDIFQKKEKKQTSRSVSEVQPDWCNQVGRSTSSATASVMKRQVRHFSDHIVVQQVEWNFTDSVFIFKKIQFNSMVQCFWVFFVCFHLLSKSLL